MTRIVICGGPKTGKTTLAKSTADHPSLIFVLVHTDDFIHLGWSEATQHIVDSLFTQPGPWIIEGVAVARALRKWRDAHPDEPPPVDRVIRLTEPHATLSRGQAAMAKGEQTVWAEIEEWLLESGVEVEYSAGAT